ncbi:hypothetical protein H8K32_09485 [Undibacterium jejuense]|uniref:Uncharacterized protein n=1 Tax=Undibacterium jejuense TaxID=1344949 RepID=A0A923HPE9_9BURK|nr:hypothetical protein [Undibacterium jejuense]
MLITTNHSLQESFRGGTNTVYYSWKCAEIDLNIPYFLFEFEVTQNCKPIQLRTLFYSITDLISYSKIAQEDTNATCIGISMLSPEWLNKSDRWQIDKLVKVLEVTMDKKLPPINVFETDDGRHFSDTCADVNLERAIDLKVLLAIE